MRQIPTGYSRMQQKAQICSTKPSEPFLVKQSKIIGVELKWQIGALQTKLEHIKILYPEGVFFVHLSIQMKDTFQVAKNKIKG